MLYNKFFGCTSSSYLTNSCAQNSLARVSREGEKISSACAAQSVVASHSSIQLCLYYVHCKRYALLHEREVWHKVEGENQ
jgi:hypothetical protein